MHVWRIRVNPAQPLFHIRRYQGGRVETLGPPFLTKPACLQSICQEAVTLKSSSHLNILDLIGIMIDNESHATAVYCRGF